MATASLDDDEMKLFNQISQVASLKKLEDIHANIKGNSILDKVYDIKKGQLESEALAEGTYFEDINGLWDFTFDMIVPIDSRKDEGMILNNLFQKIARKKRPSFYIGTGLFEPPSGDSLPQAITTSIKANSSINLESTDIFGNHFKKKRAHNAPDSKTCSPSWGHAVEGATGTINRQHRNAGKNKVRKNKIRRLLIMGAEGQGKRSRYRFSPFNFIRFSAHDEYYDKSPHIMFLPIMNLHEILHWNNTPYEVLVIASSFDGIDAKFVYRNIAHDKSIVCTPEEIEKATSSLVAFMKGLAASLLNEVPIELADLAGNEGKKAELRAVQGQIRRDGISLPRFQKEKRIRPVLKLRFDRSDDANDPITDPWMLMAKAAVNLSWCRNQKLLPACKPREAENEGDLIFWQNMADYKAKQRTASIPTTLSVPMTPNNGGPGAARNVTPEKEEDDWEYMD